MLGIVQLVIYMAKPKEYLLAVYVEETNFHLNIIGLVFATVWAAEGHWADANDIKDSSTRISTLQFNNNFPGLVSRHRPNRITLSSGSNLTTLQEVHDMVPMNSFPVTLDPSKAGLSGIKEGEVCGMYLLVVERMNTLLKDFSRRLDVCSPACLQIHAVSCRRTKHTDLMRCGCSFMIAD